MDGERDGLENVLKAALAEAAFQQQRANMARYFPAYKQIERETWFDGKIDVMIDFMFGSD